MDPPGHTVFLHLQELNRAELQKQAKLYGIKANQKSEVLRQELQRVLGEKDNIKSPRCAPVVVEEEEETRDDEVAVVVENNMVVDVDGSIVEEKPEEEGEVVEKGIANAMAPTVEQEEEQLEQPSSSDDEEVVKKEEEPNVDAASSQQQQENTIAKQEESDSVNEMESNDESAWIEGEEEADKVAEGESPKEEEPIDATQDEAENEESTAAPPQLVIVDIDSKEMADLADESIVSPTTAAAKEILFRSKIPGGPGGGSRNVLGERSMNAASRNYTSKLGKPQRHCQPSNISMIIRTKNSPPRRVSTQNTRNPVLDTQTNPRPKQMALSKRNEMQLQKFVERQNRGRKNRKEQLKRVEFANLVRSPGRA